MGIGVLILIVLQLLLAFVATDYLLTLLKRSKLYPKRHPPGPIPLPIVGNLFSLKISRPHRSLAELAKDHGPAILLKLGFSHFLVVSSPSVAREVLGASDAAFSGRYVMHAWTAVDHHLSSVVLLPPVARWRVLRRVCTTMVFANDRMDVAEGVFAKALQQLLCYVRICSKSGEAVNIGQAAFVAVLNTLTNTYFSLDLVDHGIDYAAKLRDLLSSTLEELKCFEAANLFPVLKMVDPQGNKRRVKSYFESMIRIFECIIKKRLQLRKSALAVTMQNDDLLDALLDLSDDPSDELKQSDIPHLLLDLFIGGTDTVSSTVEWAMTELLRNPQKMAKAKAELRLVIGTDNPLKGADISRLPYLRAVVKETFRLHPPTPFLVPREVFADTKLGEFTVPKNTKVLVNVWAIGRDPKVWKDADVFEPERFMDSSIDFVGNDFELIPFGSGSRMCVGMSMASKMLQLMLGSLIHSVDWKLQDGMKPEDVDVNDKLGFSLQKAKPMRAIPVLENKFF